MPLKPAVGCEMPKTQVRDSVTNSFWNLSLYNDGARRERIVRYQQTSSETNEIALRSTISQNLLRVYCCTCQLAYCCSLTRAEETTSDVGPKVFWAIHSSPFNIIRHHSRGWPKALITLNSLPGGGGGGEEGIPVKLE